MSLFSKKLSLNIILEKVTLKFWLLPAIVIVVIISLLPLTLIFSNLVQDPELKFLSNSAAETMLSTIATSFITIIGVVSSLTIVVLQKAASQYSPRVVENFIRAYSTQIMIGAYIGTFIYCVALLKYIPASSAPKELPHFSLLFSLVLSITCVAFLVHYVENLAFSIKSTSINTSIQNESLKYIHRFRDFINEHKTSEKIGPDNFHHRWEVRAGENGYYENFIWMDIKKALKNKRALVSIKPLTGDFIQEGQVLATICSNEELEGKTKEILQEAFALGSFRTHVQDTRYGLRQLVDIALRSVSPAINDPSTAVEVLNSIGVILKNVKENEEDDETLKVDEVFIKFRQVKFSELVDLSFSEIIQFGSDYRTIMHKIRSIRKIISETDSKKEEILDRFFYEKEE